MEYLTTSIFYPQVQRDDADCSIAALSMAVGIPYETIATCCRATGLKNPSRTGMYLTEMIRVMRKLQIGMKIVTPEKVLAHGYGMMIVKYSTLDYHSLAVFASHLCDPTNALIWSPDTFLANAPRGTVFQNGVLFHRLQTAKK